MAEFFSRLLAVFDINPEATKGLAEKQARVLGSPAEVAAEAEVVFACMPTIDSFHAIVSGPDGVLQGATQNNRMKTFVNLGTMGTEAVGQIEAIMNAKGIGMLDSPITGGVQRAWDGDITVVSSGPGEVFDQVEPFLQSFARDIHYVGDQIGQAEAAEAIGACENKPDVMLEDALDALHCQEKLNGGLPAAAVREGARRYRLWWNAMRNAAFLNTDDFGMLRSASTGLA